MGLNIKTSSIRQRKDILRIFFMAGGVWHKGSDNSVDVNFIERNYPWSDYPIVHVGPDGAVNGYLSIRQNHDTLNADTQFPEILGAIGKLISDGTIKKSITIKLNDSYMAEISAENVKVGCQTFDGDVIIAVAAAVEKLRKKN